ncbi:MAG: sigma-70 family RNA polymerase sigma factor [Ruminococcus sp.]|nr:sigma-70 family RNA polymerase sigma factor [Ruminococcus sp.]
MEREQTAQLAEQAKQGDRAAFEELYKEFRGKVYFFVKRLVGSGDTAEDITSETFATAFEKLSELRSGESFVGWLYSIAYSRCTHFLRNESRSISVESVEEIDELLEASALNEPILLPEDYAVNEEIKTQLKQMIDSLPEDMRSAVIMYYYDEMTVREVASAMNTSENNISQKLHRARKRIRVQVEKLIGRGAVFGAAPLSTMLANLDLKVSTPAAIGAAAAIAVPAALSAASGGTAKDLLFITRKYWSRHKRTLAALLFSGVLLCAVVCCAFLMLRANENTQLNIEYDEQGAFQLLLPDNDKRERLAAELAVDGTPTGKMLIYGKAGTGEHRFTYGAFDDPENLAHYCLKEGRLPESEGEIAIASQALGDMNYIGRVGDTISLDIGTFTLVGIIDEITWENRQWDDFEFYGTGFEDDTHTEWPYAQPSIIVAESDSTPQYTLYMYKKLRLSCDESYIIAEKLCAELGVDLFYDICLIPEYSKVANEGYTSSNLYQQDILRQEIIYFAFLAMLISVLSVIAVVRTVFAERENHIYLLRRIGVSKRQIRVMYIIECLIFTALGICIGIALGMLAYYGIYSFDVHFLDGKPYSGFTNEPDILKVTVSPYLMSVLFSVIVLPLGYVFSALLMKIKVRSHRRRKAGSLRSNLSRIFSNGIVTVIQVIALSLICFGAVLSYMLFTDNGKEPFLPMCGYSRYEIERVSRDLSFEEDGFEEYIYSLRSSSNFYGNFFVYNQQDRTPGITDDTADKLGAIATGKLEHTFIEVKDNDRLRGKLSYGSSDDQFNLFNNSSKEIGSYLKGDRKLYSIKTKLVNAAAIEELEKYLTAGRIDPDKLASGEEMILVVRSFEPPLDLGDDIIIGSAAVSSSVNIGVDSLNTSPTKIGAIITLPGDAGKLIKYAVCEDDYGLLTTQTGAEALGLHGAVYTEVFSKEHIDGSLIPTGAGMEIISYTAEKHKAFLARLRTVSGTAVIVVIMSLLGFAAYWSGIGMKIRLKEYQISTLRAIGTPISRLRRKLLADSLKIPAAAALIAYGGARLVQKVTYSAYERILELEEVRNNKMKDALLGLITDEEATRISDEFQRDYEHIRLVYLTDEQLWNTKVAVPMLIIFAAVCAVTVIITISSLRGLGYNIASSMSKGRKRQ